MLLQVLFHARIAAEDPAGFTVDDVADDLVAKLVGRHPHVFAGTERVASVADQEHRWEELKRAEKHRQSNVDGVPLAQPAAALATKLVSRARRGGWPEDLLPDGSAPGDAAVRAGRRRQAGRRRPGGRASRGGPALRRRSACRGGRRACGRRGPAPAGRRRLATVLAPVGRECRTRNLTRWRTAWATRPGAGASCTPGATADRAGLPPRSGRARPRRPVIVLLVLAAVLTVIGWVVLGQLSSQAPTGRAVRPADVPPGTAVARVASLPGGLTGDALQRWAERTAPPADVPARALRAYGAAELSVRRSDPSCRLSWATLAGIGRVESDHGRISGGEVRADGSLSEPIIGVALDGSGPVAAVPDTDRGRLDGDTEQDRAVGPMQFIPSTWERWAVDANGDGWRDPQNIDDAALGAARYLVRGRPQHVDRRRLVGRRADVQPLGALRPAGLRDHRRPGQDRRLSSPLSERARARVSGHCAAEIR